MAKIAKNHNAGTANKPSQNDIAKRAYEIYERNGCQPGREMENWLAAEAELIAAAQKPEAARRPRATPMTTPPPAPRRTTQVMARGR